MINDEEEKVEYDEEFREQAISALLDLGLPEDEAEMQVDDYIEDF